MFIKAFYSFSCMALQKKYILAARRSGSKNVFKRAWQLQKGSSASKRPKKNITRKTTMAKKRKSYSKKKSGLFGGLSRPLGAGLAYAFIQPIASQLLAKFNIGLQDEYAQILLAIVAKSVLKNKIVNYYADAAIIINTASIVSSVSGNVLGGLFSGSNTGGSMAATTGYIEVA